MQALIGFLGRQTCDWFVGADGTARVLVDVREADGRYTTEITPVASVAEARDVLGF